MESSRFISKLWLVLEALARHRQPGHRITYIRLVVGAVRHGESGSVDGDVDVKVKVKMVERQLYQLHRSNALIHVPKRLCDGEGTSVFRPGETLMVI